MGWFNLDENASHPGPAHWILVLPQILLCHSVYVFLCSIEGHFTDTPADYGHVVGIGRIADIERNPGIPLNIFVFLAPFECID